MADLKTFLVQAIPRQPILNNRYDGIVALSQNGGDGNFSAVFSARHIATDKKVALKFLADQDPYRTESFRREGTLLSGILKGEPHFVQLVEPPERLRLSANVPGLGMLPLEFDFLAFEWLPAGTVEQYCGATIGYRDLIKRLFVFRQICKCVARLHFLNCAHRDLKPGNFLIGRRLLVKLADFGTSRLFNSTTQGLLSIYTAPVGDYRYTAPEALAGVTNDARMAHAADIYSVGAILFEMITGHKLSAHTFTSIRDLIMFSRQMHATQEVQRLSIYHGYLKGRSAGLPDLRTINPGVPRCAAPVLTELLRRMSHFDYRQRLVDFSEAHRPRTSLRSHPAPRGETASHHL